MNDKPIKLDQIDRKILRALQQDASLSQRDLSERIGMSQNACWRRLQRLRASGVLKETHATVDLEAVGLDLTVFVMIRTRQHSAEWAEKFRAHVERIPEVTGYYRIGGEWDYLIKVVTNGMKGYDAFYKRLTKNFELATVTGYFVMEAIIDDRPIDILHAGA